ncbi:MAG: ECF transporter S component, partial [Aeromicrobium sp.]
MRSSRALLTCAAIGALSGLLVIGLSPVTSALALLSPPLYALVASVHMLGPLLAAAWFRRPGAATLTALVSGLVALAATTLGPLLVLALVVPA